MALQGQQLIWPRSYWLGGFFSLFWFNSNGLYVSMIPQDLARSCQYNTSAVGLSHYLLRAFQLVQNQTRKHSNAFSKYNVWRVLHPMESVRWERWVLNLTSWRAALQRRRSLVHNNVIERVSSFESASGFFGLFCTPFNVGSTFRTFRRCHRCVHQNMMNLFARNMRFEVAFVTPKESSCKAHKMRADASWHTYL